MYNFNGYKIIKEIPFASPWRFIIKYIFAFSFLPLIPIILYFVLLRLFFNSITSLFGVLETILAIVIFLLFAVIHEFIHYFVAKLIKIKSKISFKYFFKSGTLNCIPLEPYKNKQLIIFAIAPSIILTITLMVLGSLLYNNFSSELVKNLGVIIGPIVGFMHLFGCIGDFAMVNFASWNKKKDILYFDNIEKEITYIYEKR